MSEEFSRDAERLARFKREAKVLPSLNHPNIAAIYGFEQAEDTHFLVLELVPGETLAERIARGPIPIDEAIAIATKIAEGLEEAHEQGIVHRDLKPANIKLTPDDKIKILDFGLAKAFVDEAPAADHSMSPTITRDATRVGVILGTAACMSPEQAKGKRVDRRTDIFAFGSVLYEMLTGRKAFRGDGVSEVLASVMTDEPDWNPLPCGSAQRVIRRCLTKSAPRRFQHIGEARIELEDAPVDGVEVRTHRRSVLLMATTLLATAVAVAGWLRGPEAPEIQTVSRWRISLPPGASISGSNKGRTAPAVAISPDGRHLAYNVMREGNTQLYLKTAEALDAVPVEGADNASMPFFSADSRALGFLSPNGILMRVSLNGGAPVVVTEVGLYGRGARWSADGNITFGANSGELRRMPASGGTSEVLAVPDQGAGIKALRLTDLLPGGEAILLTIVDVDVDSADEATIAAFWPRTGDMRVLVQGGASAQYSPSGHLVYARAGALYAAPFDAADVEMTGDPVRVVEGVASHPTMGQSEFSLSRDGSLLYAPGDRLYSHSRVVWVDRTGKATTIADEPRALGGPRVSPDGRLLALGTDGLNMSIWRYDIGQGTLTRIVSGHNNTAPVWTPDGARIAFMSERNGSQDLFSIAADGSGAARVLLDAEHHQLPLSWAPDGRTLLFSHRDAGTSSKDLWLLTESGKTAPVLATTANEDAGQISPDGGWMAYQSDESGRPEIYICTFPAAESRQRVSVDGGTDPRWNPRGGELFYRDGNKMMVVEVDRGGDLAGRPHVLFESPHAFGQGSYDVSADGERFVMVDVSRSAQPPTELVLMKNWAEELKRLVPVH